MNASADKAKLAKSWLDTDITDIELEDFGIGPARWVVLWGFVLAGGFIPEGERAWEFQMAIPTVFIAAFWHKSALHIKLALTVGFSLISFLNANLPIPGPGYGYLVSSPDLSEPGAMSWLLALGGTYCGASAVLITFLHFLLRIPGWFDSWWPTNSFKLQENDLHRVRSKLEGLQCGTKGERHS